MAYETILASVEDGIGTITLNRPEVFNAINKQMVDDLHAVLDAWEQDDAVRALILTSAGGKAFMSGAIIDASEAQRIGLVDEVVRNEEVLVSADQNSRSSLESQPFLSMRRIVLRRCVIMAGGRVTSVSSATMRSQSSASRSWTPTSVMRSWNSCARMP